MVSTGSALDPGTCGLHARQRGVGVVRPCTAAAPSSSSRSASLSVASSSPASDHFTSRIACDQRGNTKATLIEPCCVRSTGVSRTWTRFSGS
jgi:hypothetical protein